MKLASIPCGLMDDLLTLDFSNSKNLSLTRIDLDVASLNYAKNNNEKLQSALPINFLRIDAWEIIPETWDLITSNGLNIYVAVDEKCTDLNKSFASKLKANGTLIFSTITPSETQEVHNLEDLNKQSFIFKEVIPVKWQSVRSEEKTVAQLESAGFKISNIIYDAQKMFPTFVANKAS